LGDVPRFLRPLFRATMYILSISIFSDHYSIIKLLPNQILAKLPEPLGLNLIGSPRLHSVDPRIRHMAVIQMFAIKR
jgi:hypothetical protein